MPYVNAPVNAASRSWGELDPAWQGVGKRMTDMFPSSEVLLAIHIVLPFTKHQAISKAGQVNPFSLIPLIPALRAKHIALLY